MISREGGYIEKRSQVVTGDQIKNAVRGRANRMCWQIKQGGGRETEKSRKTPTCLSWTMGERSLTHWVRKMEEEPVLSGKTKSMRVSRFVHDATRTLCRDPGNRSWVEIKLGSAVYAWHKKWFLEEEDRKRRALRFRDAMVLKAWKAEDYPLKRKEWGISEVDV